jgi:hypothetical protein
MASCVSLNLNARARHGEHSKFDTRSTHGGKALLAEIREGGDGAVVLLLGDGWRRVGKVV